MASDQLQIDYEGLRDLELIVEAEKNRIRSLIHKLAVGHSHLQRGFQGPSADAFLADFDENFLSRLKRLHEALEACEMTMAIIGRNFQEAEEQAAKSFSSS